MVTSAKVAPAGLFISSAIARREAGNNQRWAEMWVQVKATSNLIVAEAWKELLEDAGIPCRLWWNDPRSRDDVSAPCQVMVPNSRVHIAENVISRC